MRGDRKHLCRDCIAYFHSTRSERKRQKRNHAKKVSPYADAHAPVDVMSK